MTYDQPLTRGEPPSADQIDTSVRKAHETAFHESAMGHKCQHYNRVEAAMSAGQRGCATFADVLIRLCLNETVKRFIPNCAIVHALECDS